MACMLYARLKGRDIRLGKFKTKEKAQEYFRIWLNGLNSHGEKYPEPIYVEYGRRKK